MGCSFAVQSSLWELLEVCFANVFLITGSFAVQSSLWELHDIIYLY